MDITSLTAVELGKKIKAKEISVVEAVKASIAQIEKVEKDVNRSFCGKIRCAPQNFPRNKTKI